MNAGPQQMLYVNTGCYLGKKRIHSNDELFASHVRAWTSLWSRGRVDIDGDLSLARAAYGSWYYILSSLPVNYHPQFVGLSPCGLPHSDEQVTLLWFDMCYCVSSGDLCVCVQVICHVQYDFQIYLSQSYSIEVWYFNGGWDVHIRVLQ